MLALAGCAEKPRAEEVQHEQIEARTAPNPDDVGAGVWAISRSIEGVYMLAQGAKRGSDIRDTPVRMSLAATATADWAALLGQWHDWDIDRMMRIIECESHGDENAVSPPDYDGLRNYGIYQNHNDPASLDPVYATERAHEKWLASGYQPWVGSKGCWG